MSKNLAIRVLLSLFTLFCYQQVVVAQSQSTIVLNVNNVPLSDALKKLEKATDYKILFTYNDVRSYRVSASVKTSDINAALKQLLSGKPFTYVVNGNYISIIHQDNAKSQSSPSAQRRTLRGTVTDNDDKPLPGVTVRLLGTKTAAVTDANGNFSIAVPQRQSSRILFTYVGMEDRVITCSDRTQDVSISLRENVKEFGTVNVISNGMFTRKMESFTGSATTYNRDQLKRVGNKDILTSLKNLDPSFTFTDNLAVGSNPNSLPDIQMRGQNSLPDLKGTYETAPNQPLFIVDGFETSLEKVYDMDMNRVESVTLLKDASAKAIYGSKAANGVVVIETRRPEAGKLHVSYSGSLDLEVADLSSYHLTNASQKLQAEVMAGKYVAADPRNQIALTTQYNELYNDIARGVDTYWLSQPLHTGVGNKHSVIIEGGDSGMRYSMDLSYNKVTGAMKGSDRSTLSGDINLSYRYKTLRFNNQLSVTDNKSKESPYGSFSDYASMEPYYRIYDDDGNLIKQYDRNIYNPLYNATLANINQNKYTDITENFYGEWEAIKNLRFTARFGLSKTLSSSDLFVSADNTQFATIPVESDQYMNRGSYTQTHGNAFSYSLDAGVAYALTLNKNLLYTNLLYNLRSSSTENSGMTAVGFPSDKMDYISFANSYQIGGKPSGSEGKTHSTGFTGALNYSYDNRYLADFSYRLNASSQFGSKHRWGSFWSVGLGWNLHNEAFLKNNKYITYAKLRGSYGSTGSQNFSPYQSQAMLEYITDHTYDGALGVRLMGLANDRLGWQKQYDTNLGLDLSLLRVLNMRFDYYVANTKSLLSSITLPPSTGFNSYMENLGETQNKGIEFSANWNAWRDNTHRAYLNLFFNIVHNKNKITKITDALTQMNKEQEAQLDDVTLSDEVRRNPLTRFEEGQSMSTIWAVRSAGIDPITGREVFIKKDGSQTFDYSVDDLVPCGDSNPDVQGNFGFQFSYQGLELGCSFNYKLGGQTYNSTLVGKVENVDVNTSNVDVRVLNDRWNTPGVPAKYKGIANNTLTKATSRFVEDLNELNFASLNFGYDFSNLAFVRKSPLEYLKLTFNMNDVAYISTVKRERGTDYPFARNFSFTLSARF